MKLTRPRVIVKTIEQRAAEIAAQWEPLTEAQLLLIASTFQTAQNRNTGGM